jgi:hypothetical protein
VNAEAKSPSVLRVVVIAGATAVLASAVTPVHAAPAHQKRTFLVRKPPSLPRRGGAGPVLLEWMTRASLRP